MIAFEGIIGSGKTTLARALSGCPGGRRLEEDLSGCPFLDDFYRDPIRYATETEFSFLLLHYHQLFKADSFETTIADFTLAKDVVFARCNLNPTFLPSFEKLYTLLSTAVPKPEVCVYLRVDPKLAFERIVARGRTAEMSMTLDYLHRLSQFYDTHLQDLLPSVVSVDVEASDSPESILKRISPNLPAPFSLWASNAVLQSDGGRLN